MMVFILADLKADCRCMREINRQTMSSSNDGTVVTSIKYVYRHSMIVTLRMTGDRRIASSDQQ